MRFKQKFSILELMTVILVILLLISLLIPTFLNLKMNARSAICKSNLRQMGVLLTSYQSDQNGYLPNDEVFYRHADGVPCGYIYSCKKSHIPGDIQIPKAGQNNNLYQGWNGHLMPYMSVNLPDNYTRVAMVTKVCTRSNASQLGGPANPPPANVTQNGWVVIDDAYHLGGHQDLKLFICPEMHQNNFDVATSLKFNNIKIPRVSQLITPGHTPWSAFADAASWDYGMGGGMPTSYQANETFFGKGAFINSVRLDEINELSSKALILEGKGATSGLYYGLNQLSGSDSFNQPNWDPSDPGLSFVHDANEQFWIMKQVGFEWWRDTNYYMECANRFNVQYAGKAYMVYGYNPWASKPVFSIVSYVFPGVKGDLYNGFLKAYDAKVSLTPFIGFIDEPNEYRYLTGRMNVLFGDGSAETKSQDWLFNNRLKIAAPSQE